MQMDVIATTRRSAAIALAVTALVFVLLLGWIGGELHYGGCVASAEARYPAPANAYPSDLAPRERAVEGCSRFPW